MLLLLDSDRYVFPLLEFLTSNAQLPGWKIKAGALFDARVLDRVRSAPFADKLEFVEFKKMQECEQAIRKSDVVIALVQDALLLQIADSVIANKKTLISPARLTRQMALKKADAKENNALILMDCGFSPGLDHIIAKKAIDNIHSKGGTISSFKTYSGILLSEKSESNPWRFKLTEPANEILGWGRHTNRHLLKGRMQHIPCYRLFERGQSVIVRDRDDLVAIPEGDSLYYKKIYDLNDAHTVVKARLVQKGFDHLWHVLVRLGLTDLATRVDFSEWGSYRDLVESLLPASLTGSIEERVAQYTGADPSDIESMQWLGLFDSSPWNPLNREVSPGQMLQALIQEKLAMQDGDSDCVIMEHHLGYEFRDDHYQMTATLILEGDSEQSSALARVIGFTCGAAAKSVLSGFIKLKGIHIPILREIYDPILNELEELGIAFHMTEKKQAALEDVTPAGNNG